MKDKKKILFFGIRIFLLVLMVVIWGFKHNFDFLKYYDAECYLEIARNGYSSEKLYAFFPLFPLLIKIFSLIIRSYVLSALLINFVCSVISYVVIDKLVDDKNRLWLYIFSPVVIFFSIIYTESLFLMLTLLGYYYYKNKNILLSSIFIGLSIITRNTGVLLFFAVLVDYFYNLYKNRNGSVKDFVLIVLIPIFMGSLYPIYLYYKMGNFLYFIDVQYIYWGRVSLLFVFGFIDDIKFIINNGFSGFDIYLIIQNWLWTVYAFFLFLKIIKKDRVSSLYGILSIMVFVSSFRDIGYWKTIASISLFRYVLGLYPLYLYSNVMNNKILSFVVRTSSLCNIFMYFFGLFVA